MGAGESLSVAAGVQIEAACTGCRGDGRVVIGASRNDDLDDPRNPNVNRPTRAFATETMPRGTVHGVDVCSGGRTCATAGADGRLRVWSTGTGKPTRAFPCADEGAGEAVCVAVDDAGGVHHRERRHHLHEVIEDEVLVVPDRPLAAADDLVLQRAAVGVLHQDVQPRRRVPRAKEADDVRVHELAKRRHLRHDVVDALPPPLRDDLTSAERVSGEPSTATIDTGAGVSRASSGGGPSNV